MKVCAEPGCPSLTTSTYCLKHKRERRKHENRGPHYAWAQKQYKSQRWQQMRSAQLAKRPHCECPYHGDEKVPATVADHKDAHRGDARKFWNPANLMSLCHYCHCTWAQSRDHQARKAQENHMGGRGC